MGCGEKPFGRAITYGTFDLFHFGHLQLLRRISLIAEQVYVGVATDDFNSQKGKKSVIPFEHRCEIVSAIRLVDHVFGEETWDQKRSDIMKFKADLFVMGDDWAGHFDDLNDICVVRYLPRTNGVSSSLLKETLKVISGDSLTDLQNAIGVVSDVLSSLGDK
jgi:glycerol-3-phosphate cytidylyltransferase